VTEKSHTDDVETNRRRFLKTAGAMGVAGAAGCLGDGDSGTEAPTETAGETPTDGTSTAETSTDPPAQTATETATPTATPQEYSVLVLSVTEGERRDAVPAGNDALRSIGDDVTGRAGIAAFGVDVIDSATTDDYQSAIPSTAGEFAEYDAVVFQNTTGTVLDADQRSAFREYIENGGGFLGVHAAAETHADWDWYGNELLGTVATGSVSVQEAQAHVTDRTHPATDHLPARWTREDQWYDFAESPRGDVHVLATLDERTYDGGMGAGFGRDHPIAWCQNVERGRALYTGLGHTTAAFDSDAFGEHLSGALLWAVGHAAGSAHGTVWDAYEKETIFEDVVEPMEIGVTPDGHVVYIERTGGDFGGPSADRPGDHGAVKVVDPATGAGTTALELPIFLMDGTGYPKESGLLGLTLDPDFGENGWLYLYHTTDTGDGVVNRVSRFTLEGTTIDPDTETVIIDIPHFGLNHQAGSLDFDSQGNLHIATGDDTTPFESSGYTAIDERDGRRDQFDAQRSSGNTNDLRGSILRITPQDGGGYTVPEDNLFTEAHGYGDVDDSKVRPEIWAMGMRNPFTLKIDRETDVPYAADYGPDAGGWSASRGPPGQTSFNQLDEPGFYGWPYFKGANIPYRDYDFATGESGEIFDPTEPVNDSPANDGLQQLPPAIEPMIPSPVSWGGLLDNPSEWDPYMPYESTDEVPFPQVTGGSPMQGPIYRRQEGYADTTALPASYDGKIFMMGWSGGWMKYATLDDDGDVMEVDPFMPDAEVLGAQDMTVGPDGSLYLLEWGGTYGDVDPRVSRIKPSADLLPVSLSLDNGPLSGEIRVASQVSATVSAELTNDGSAPITDGAIQLDASSSDISVSGASGASFDSLAAGESLTAEWSVTLPGDLDSGSYSLETTATYRSGGTEITLSDTGSFTVS
jgi:glucose/arabinose dehydrogenase